MDYSRLKQQKEPTGPTPTQYTPSPPKRPVPLRGILKKPTNRPQQRQHSIPKAVTFIGKRGSRHRPGSSTVSASSVNPDRNAALKKASADAHPRISTRGYKANSSSHVVPLLGPANPYSPLRPDSDPDRTPPGRRDWRDRESPPYSRNPVLREDPQHFAGPMEEGLMDGAKLGDMDSLRGRRLRPGAASIVLYSILVALTLVAFGFLSYNEWRMAASRRHLQPLRSEYVPVSCEPKDENTGALVHIDCPLNVESNPPFYPPVEFEWNVKPFHGVFFEMKVEMYQWVLRPGGFGLSFTGEWSDSLVPTPDYPFIFYNSHVNPEFFPRITGAGREYAESVYAGKFRLSQSQILSGFKGKTQLTLMEDGYYRRSPDRPPARVDYANTLVRDNALYTGNPEKPQIGDLRLTFWGSTATHVSAIATQGKLHSGEYGLEGYTDSSALGVAYLEGVAATSNVSVQLFREGDYSPDELLATALRRLDGPPTVVWGTRAGAAVLLLLTVAFGHRMCCLREELPFAMTLFGSLFMSITIFAGFMGGLWSSYSLLWGGVIILCGCVGLALALTLWCWPLKNGDPSGVTPRRRPPRTRPAPGDDTHYYQAV